MRPPRTQEDLERFISNKIEENLHIEYKAAGALDRKDVKKKEITKDVSAMANAAGGIIIYGIQEHSDPGLLQLPARLDPIDPQVYSKEWLDEIITQIQPTIPDLEIIPVPVTVDGVSGYCYVVVVPQSRTAHQARDMRYYRRRNFMAEPVDDYEVREMMSRVLVPKLSVKIRYMLDQPAPDGSSEIFSRIAFRITNESDVMARHYAIVASIPTRLPSGELVHPEKGALDEEGSRAFWVFKLANSSSPIFPHEEVIKRIRLSRRAHLRSGMKPSSDKIYLTLYADNAPARQREILLEDALNGWV